MAKRYYVCRRAGDGTEDNVYRSEIAEYMEANHPTHKPSRIVISHTSLIVLTAYDLPDTIHDDIVANISDVFSFLASALPNLLSSVNPTKRNKVKTKLEGAGFDFDWAMLSDSVRDVLQYVAHTIVLSEWTEIIIAAKNFDVNKTVSQISQAQRDKISAKMSDLNVDSIWIVGSTIIQEIINRVKLDKGYMFKDLT